MIFKSDEEDEEEEDDLDQDEIFETPPSNTPPSNTESTPINADDLQSSIYSTFDLHLNELQTIIGRFNSDNLQSHLQKGRSSFHLLEKFDIHIQIDLLKLKTDNEQTAPLKINISLDLLKLHIDDLKLISIYRTIENIQSVFSKNEQEAADLVEENDQGKESLLCN